MEENAITQFQTKLKKKKMIIDDQQNAALFKLLSPSATCDISHLPGVALRKASGGQRDMAKGGM